jgi:hypothetical protein
MNGNDMEGSDRGVSEVPSCTKPVGTEGSHDNYHSRQGFDSRTSREVVTVTVMPSHPVAPFYAMRVSHIACVTCLSRGTCTRHRVLCQNWHKVQTMTSQLFCKRTKASGCYSQNEM